jgi:hypothetical protein
LSAMVMTPLPPWLNISMAITLGLSSLRARNDNPGVEQDVEYG